MRHVKLRNETAIDDLVHALGSVVAPHSGIYSSAPITGGVRLYAMRSELLRIGGTETPEAIANGVVEPNVSEARALAASLRERFGYKVIDPSSFFAPSWAQEHYAGLWEAVVRRYAEFVVFADGWELSNGCTQEFVIAHQAGIATVDSALRPLSREAGMARIAEIAAKWKPDEAAPAFLRARLAQLADLRPLDRADRFAADPPCEDRVTLCVDMLGTMATPSGSIFLCSPAPDEGWTAAVRMRAAQAVIDPWVFKPAHWPHALRDALWEKVLERYAARVVVAEQWESSPECRRFVAEAGRLGIPAVASGESIAIADVE